MADNNPSLSPINFESPDKVKNKLRLRVSTIKVLVAIIIAIALPVLFFILNAKAVIVDTNTPNSEVIVSNSIHLPIGNSLLLMHGEHQVTIKSAGYYDFSKTLMVDSDTPQQVTYELTPLPGNLSVSLKADETVLLEGTLTAIQGGESYQASGESQLYFEQIPAGSYRLVLDANLYAEKTLDVDIEGKQLTEQVSAELEPNWGYVKAQTSPSNVALYANGTLIQSELDDVRNQSGEYEARLEAGLYKVELKLADHKPVIREFTLAPEQVFDFGETTLELVDSTVTLVTQPQGVTVLLNGQYAGETPLTLDLLPQTDHDIKLFKSGFESKTDKIRVAKNDKIEKRYQLAPDLIPISVSVFPDNATLTIDNQIVDITDKQIKLPALQHKVSVTAPGYAPKELDFLPIRGTRQLLQVRLLTEEQAIWAEIPAQYQSINGSTMKLFRQAGNVEMGSNRREIGRRANETVWQANLSRPFYVSLTEVTNLQYKAFAPEHSSGNYNGVSLDGAKQPVINVSWQQAALYCNWLSEKEGLTPFYTTKRGFVAGVNEKATGYRLLTEAEWTWLSKYSVSGFAKKYIWGDEDQVPGAIENYADSSVAKFINFTQSEINDGFIASSPVASFEPNEKGLYDLSGNVNEWVHDWYAPMAYPSNQEVTDPLGPEEGEFHVIRGASWARGYLPQLRLAYRDYDSTGRNDLGFRVARYAM